MSKNLKIEKYEQKNKNKQIIGRVFNIKPKTKKKIHMTDVNRIYKRFLEKYNSRDIIITAMLPDGHKTIKSMNDDSQDIRFALDDYYRSYGDDVIDKFENVFEFNVIVKNIDNYK